MWIDLVRDFTANGRDHALGDRFALGIFELMIERQALGADTVQGDIDRDDLFELDRLSVIAFGSDSRKRDGLAIDLTDDAESQVTQHCVLRFFHVGEKD